MSHTTLLALGGIDVKIITACSCSDYRLQRTDTSTYSSNHKPVCIDFNVGPSVLPSLSRVLGMRIFGKIRWNLCCDMRSFGNPHNGCIFRPHAADDDSLKLAPSVVIVVALCVCVRACVRERERKRIPTRVAGSNT